VQTDFNSRTWQAFQRFDVDGEPAARVAQDLGITENAVILAKARVLKRLRHEAGELFERARHFRDRFDAELTFTLR
jgi:RNA polymerase sigma-70 factor, ECF subfamily